MVCGVVVGCDVVVVGMVECVGVVCVGMYCMVVEVCIGVDVVMVDWYVYVYVDLGVVCVVVVECVVYV